MTKKPDTDSSSKDVFDDFEELLEQVILQEVTQAVWERFEGALAKFDPESLEILETHLDGVPVEKLSNDKKLSTKDAESLIKQMKKDLVRHLRKDCNVRH
ncbi:MAG: hypothetical protein H6617_02075 [Bdellovibrionaceae bacterium]|nr:hypothetical protein [Bdellovibrionales bacterium]MCB9253452.1 hypothetical protein [Pseudobdellovibrionaceae bacterium]